MGALLHDTRVPHKSRENLLKSNQRTKWTEFPLFFFFFLTYQALIRYNTTAHLVDL